MNNCVLYNPKEEKCRGLSRDGFVKTMEEEKCGTSKCPFYKTEQEQIEIEERCRKRLIDIDYIGVHYKGIYNGLVTGKR